MYRASYRNVYINQRDAQILLNGLYWYMPVRLAAARRTGTNVQIALYSLLNVAPDDGLMVVRNM